MMKLVDWRSKVLLAIAWITILSGLVQVIVPGVLLTHLGAQDTPTTRHCFGIVGMFMTLFGGSLVHGLLSARNQPVVVLWASLQKVGAFTAVGLGVLHHIFAPIALAVATFDLATGLLGLWFWWSIREPAVPGRTAS